jgi:hypothetical protein
MTFTDRLAMRWAVWRRLPGWSYRARFARLFLRALVLCAEREAERDLTIEEAAHLMRLFTSWQTCAVADSAVLDDPIRTINLYLTTEPWQRQLAAGDRPDAQEAAS